MAKQYTNDFGTLIEAIIGNVHRNLHVSTLARVINVGSYDSNGLQVIGVKPFPQRDNVDIISMECYSICDDTIMVGDIVNIIYTDRDYRGNLKTTLNGNDKIYTTNDERLHSVDYGLITSKFSFPKYIKLDTEHDTFEIRLVNAVKDGDFFHCPLVSFELLIPQELIIQDTSRLFHIEFQIFSDIVNVANISFPTTNNPIVTAIGMYHDEQFLLKASIHSDDDTLASMQVEFMMYDNSELPEFDSIRLSAVVDGRMFD